MAIREELVASAAQFLQDPSVASSSVENRISFLQSKNLTQEEIDAALARAGGQPAPPKQSAVSYPQNPPQQYYPPYPPQAWQPPPPPRRDWRDWFIVATVVGGVSYGLYSLGKRYVYPLVAPPTPDRLEQDKKLVEEQFDKAFALMEQLSRDTEELKERQIQRTEVLDDAMEELKELISELDLVNKRREGDAQRLRDEVQALKGAIPKALDNQKDLTDNRLKEINTELTSLKTLVSQRVSSGSAATTAPSANHLRPSPGNASPSMPAAGQSSAAGSENKPDTDAAVAPTTAETKTTPDAPKSFSSSNFNRGSSAVNGGSGGKASIPAWQMAMANKNSSDSASASGANDATSSSSA